MPPHLSTAQLHALAQAAPGPSDCAACGTLNCPGWEALPGWFDDSALLTLGTLRDGSDEPTWEEHHPQGTRTDSPTAPIAPAYHPYNRSDVMACRACGRLFLHYTEAGGYYVERRVRAVDAALVVTPPA